MCCDPSQIVCEFDKVQPCANENEICGSALVWFAGLRQGPQGLGQKACAAGHCVDPGSVDSIKSWHDGFVGEMNQLSSLYDAWDMEQSDFAKGKAVPLRSCILDSFMCDTPPAQVPDETGTPVGEELACNSRQWGLCGREDPSNENENPARYLRGATYANKAEVAEACDTYSIEDEYTAWRELMEAKYAAELAAEDQGQDVVDQEAADGEGESGAQTVVMSLGAATVAMLALN